MQKRSFVVLAVCALVAVPASLALAQAAPGVPAAPAPSAQGAPAASAAPAQTPAVPVSSAVANPTYIVVALETDVNRPAAEVWKRVGKYCDIGEWARFTCTMTKGNEGDFGSVRSVGNEILVGKTDLSYTYTQPVRDGRPYNMYHGTLEARPVSATTSKLFYTLVLDNSMLADDAARERDKANRTTQVTGWLANMKILAEGGTLPPAPPRRGGPGAGAAPAAPGAPARGN
jgi:hypothetical protein